MDTFVNVEVCVRKYRARKSIKIVVKSTDRQLKQGQIERQAYRKNERKADRQTDRQPENIVGPGVYLSFLHELHQKVMKF